MQKPLSIAIVLISLAPACAERTHATERSPAKDAASIDFAAPRVAAAIGSKLFLDVHRLGAGNVTAEAAAAAHQKDLAVQAKHGVKYLKYWVDLDSGSIFCLSEAPNAEAALAVHRDAHGLMPASIQEVVEGR